jgi:hypothetical protein
LQLFIASLLYTTDCQRGKGIVQTRYVEEIILSLNHVATLLAVYAIDTPMLPEPWMVLQDDSKLLSDFVLKNRSMHIAFS